MAKSPNLLAKIWYGLTVHIRFLILNLQSKIFQFFKFTLVFWQKFPANYANSMQFALQFRKTCKIRTIYLCFRCLPRQRTLRNSSESSKIRSIHPQIP